MLRALQKLLRPAGRVAFTTIYVTPGLSDADRRRARGAGPRAVASRSTYRQLLGHAGFVDIDELDVTGEFIETARAWLDERDRHRDALVGLEPPGAFDQRQTDHRAQLAATEAGLLRRAIFSACRREGRGSRPS